MTCSKQGYLEFLFLMKLDIFNFKSPAAKNKSLDVKLSLIGSNLMYVMARV
mgnify:CR=1 FL=1